MYVCMYELISMCVCMSWVCMCVHVHMSVKGGEVKLTYTAVAQLLAMH